MDTTPEYVNMCEKAVEIQRLKRYRTELKDNDLVEDGDVFFCLGDSFGDYYHGPTYGKGDIFISCGMSNVHYDFGDLRVRSDGSKYSFDESGLIWLPRQDQLQDMIIGKKRYREDLKDLLGLLSDVRAFGYGYPNFTSMEMLWIAFVMKELYKKHWTGSDWELIKNRS